MTFFFHTNHIKASLNRLVAQIDENSSNVFENDRIKNLLLDLLSKENITLKFGGI